MVGMGNRAKTAGICKSMEVSHPENQTVVGGLG
jgi:hypothetical protein